MSDVESYIRKILLASRGEDVRDSLVGALKNLHRSIPVTVEEALAEAKASGLFDGAQGPPGDSNQIAIDSVPTQDSENAVSSGAVYNALSGKQDTLSLDSTPKQGSSNPITSGAVYNALSTKQDTLSLDSTPKQGSSNPITSGAVYNALQNVAPALALDDAPTENSANPIKSGAVYEALQSFQGGSNPDWNQNDSSADDYIRNRPFYENIRWTKTYSGQISTGNSMVGFYEPYAYYYSDQTVKSFTIKLGERYRIIADGTEYYADAFLAEYRSSTRTGAALEFGRYLIVTQNPNWTYCYCKDGYKTCQIELYRRDIEITTLDSKYLSIDSTPTSGSNNPVASGGVYSQLQELTGSFAPEFRDAAKTGLLYDFSDAFQQAKLLLTYSNTYYQITFAALFNYLVYNRVNASLFTGGKTIGSAINELYYAKNDLWYQVNTLQSSIDELQNTINSLQNTVNTLRTTVGDQAVEIESLRDRVAVLESYHRSESTATTAVMDSDGTVHLSGGQTSIDESGVVTLDGAVMDIDGVVHFNGRSSPTASMNANGEVSISGAAMDESGIVHLEGGQVDENGVVQFSGGGASAALNADGTASIPGATLDSNGVAALPSASVDENGVVQS